MSLHINLQPRCVRPVKRIANHHRHPRQRRSRHIGALGKGEAVQQPVVERIETRSELEIRFVNVSQTCGCAFGNKRCNPVCVRIAQRTRAKRIDVDRDRSRHQVKIRTREWARHAACVPTIIESTIGHRIRLGKKSRRILVHDWNPDFVKLSYNFSEPFVTSSPTSDSLVCTIDIRATP